MYARSTTFQARPGTIDEGICYVRDQVFPAAMAVDGYVGLSMICDRETGRSITTSALPALQEMGGFCSVSLMVDRDTGCAVSSATFESRETMVASRPAAERLRSGRTGDLGAMVTDTQEFELVLAHLHVPELRADDRSAEESP